MLKVFIILAAVLLGSCSVSGGRKDGPTQAAGQAKPDSESPAGRVASYHEKLTRGDVTAYRFYSKQLLSVRLDDREASAQIAGFEMIFGRGSVRISKEEPSADGERISVTTAPGFPLNYEVRLELMKEDGAWYVDKMIWPDGEVVKGFDASPSPAIVKMDSQ